MSTTCRACKGPAQTFLCAKCTKSARDLLAELPWWIDRLNEAVVGQVKLHDGGGSSRPVMHGDTDLASHIRTLPGCTCVEECDCDPLVARRKRERAALVHALALGGVNATASDLHAEISNTLGTWIRHLCESRGAQPPQLATAGRMAQWMRSNVDAIAADESAGECVDELADIRKRIERTINRREPRKFLGHCPTWNEESQKACGRELSAPSDADHVRCKHCRTTHNCNRLQLLLVGDMEREKVTATRVRALNRLIPQEYRIPERTLRHWIATGKLKARGNNGNGEPMYLWADVRKMRANDSNTDTAR